MGKNKPPKKSPPPKISPTSKAKTSPSPKGQVEATASTDKSSSSPSKPNAQLTVATTDLAISAKSQIPVVTVASDLENVDSVKVAPSTEPEKTEKLKVKETIPSPPASANAAAAANPETVQAATSSDLDSWVNMVKGSSRLLKKKGTPYTLPSGESCVKIPNSVIERGRKSWECFIIGQFYYDPPSQGTIHNIVNGIWSKQYRDISVTKLEGKAFLFRIPKTTIIGATLALFLE